MIYILTYAIYVTFSCRLGLMNCTLQWGIFIKMSSMFILLLYLYTYNSLVFIKALKLVSPKFSKMFYSLKSFKLSTDNIRWIFITYSMTRWLILLIKEYVKVWFLWWIIITCIFYLIVSSVCWYMTLVPNLHCQYVGIH